ncbi:MAG: ABC transporter ATP-binding protein/permease [Bacilli bacterium]|nr:ABC transporter ATP-binding protein/permease [Bacilli bacterium]
MRIGILGLLTQSIQVSEMTFFIKVVIMTLIYIPISFLLQISSRMLRIKYMRNTIFDFRIAAFDKIMNTSYHEFNMKSKEIYISNLVNDINIFEKDFFINLLNVIFRGGIYFISLIIAMFIDWKLGLALFAISVMVFYLAKGFSKKTERLQKEVSAVNEKMTVNIANVFNGLEIIKLNNIEERFLLNSNRVVEDVEISKFNFRFFTAGQRNLTSLIGLATVLGLLLYLVIKIQNGMDYGIAMVLVMLTDNITLSLPDIFPRLNVIKSSNAIYKKITAAEKENTIIEKPNAFRFEKEIRVENLNFSLDEKPIFSNLSLSIQKGKKYLIKGPSGIGKSTLIKLLAMIYENYQGDIAVDGVDYRSINEKSFNNAIAFVYQDVFLFEDTIKNNIALYKDLSPADLNKAVDKAGLHMFIKDKENGIDTVITENGKNLSGGERQRISIARAIAKDAAIIFIDEGTSSLNEELGREIEKTFLSLAGTVINVSHRYYHGISENYDYVLEIKNGKINMYPGNVYFATEVNYV